MDDAYEFYPCLVDGAPASIYLNMRFEHDPQPQATTAYWLAVRIDDRGEHGVGTAAEAELLNAFEESAIDRLSAAGLVYAGRVRSSGMWETTFYGPPGHVDDVRALTQSLADHRAEVGALRTPSGATTTTSCSPTESAGSGSTIAGSSRCSPSKATA